MMTEVRKAQVNFIGQFLLAIFQIIAVLGVMSYIFAIEPPIPTGGEGLILAILGFGIGGIIHAIWRILNGYFTWQAAKEQT
jgi:hypothetical protein